MATSQLERTARTLSNTLIYSPKQLVERLFIYRGSHTVPLAPERPAAWQHQIWFCDTDEELELVHPGWEVEVACTFAFNFRCFAKRVGDADQLNSAYTYKDLLICEGVMPEQVYGCFSLIYRSHAILISQFLARSLGYTLEYDPREKPCPNQNWEVTEAMQKLRNMTLLLTPARMEEFTDFVEGRLFP